MIDDLLRQIEEVIGEEGASQDNRDQRGNIVVGNQSTVVIGDGNQVRRRESDQQKGEGDDTRCYGRRESDHAIREELKQLRIQVKDLVQLVTKFFLKNGSEGFKDDLPGDSACRNSNDGTPSKSPRVSFCSRMAETPLVKPKRRATPRSVSHCPIQSHFIPDVSYLMAAHIRR